MYQCWTWRHGTVPGKNFEVASPICQECAPKKVTLKEGIELITLGFGCHVLTSTPIKLLKVTLPERRFSSRFSKFAKAMAKVCAERKNRTRHICLLVRCRKL